MIITSNFATAMYNEIDGTKQISRFAATEVDVMNWAHTINVFSSLGYKKRMMGDDELCDFELPNALQDLAIPRKISYSLGEEFKDFRGKSYSEYMNNLNTYGMDKAVILDAVKFNRVSKAIAGSRKAQHNGVAVDTLIGEKTVESYEDRLNNLSAGLDKATIKVNSAHYVPIDFQYNYMEDEFYTQKVKSVFLKWFSDALDNLKNA